MEDGSPAAEDREEDCFFHRPMMASPARDLRLRRVGASVELAEGGMEDPMVGLWNIVVMCRRWRALLGGVAMFLFVERKVVMRFIQVIERVSYCRYLLCLLSVFLFHLFR